ncbi:HAD-IC family P-type ATPase [Patescibacteria group bacterium]|nr:HAD-IC family P-type ATPase [Patescibacteria group bacterium]
MENLWHHLSGDQIEKRLQTSKNGITEKEAQKRLKKYGPNQLPAKKKLPAFKLFINQFKSPLVYILLGASIISCLLKELNDALIIALALLINALVGFIQESKAEKTFLRLKSLVHHSAKVIRQGKTKIIPSSQLVPGDIIILGAGDLVPADARLQKNYDLQSQEAALTGESEASRKKNEILPANTNLADRENMVYFGTNITQGKGQAIVVSTGLETKLGQIAQLIKETKERSTPLQKKITSLAQTITFILGGLCLLLFSLGLIRGYSLTEMILTSVAVAVAGIPEGLAIAVTVCLAIGMQSVLRKKALVKKLVAAETLGSVDIIAVDKTGTITKGIMSVDQIHPGTQKNAKDLMRVGLLCNNAIIKNLEKKEMQGDTTETALLKAALEFGLKKEKIEKIYPRLDEIPFDSQNMYMATLHAQPENKGQIILVKGAPEKILEFCNLEKKKEKEIRKEFEQLTKKGLRVLAFAQQKTRAKEIKKELLADLDFVGFIALKDPLRPAIKETIKNCQAAGIRPLLITGDHKLTAANIAQEIGLSKNFHPKILDGEELDQISDQKLAKLLKSEANNIFARVEPRHKIRIVKILQSQDHVIAMTGDGINDAPAIKAADIGIALGSGSEVTKETADIILLDDNLQTIIETVKTGRNIFSNIQRVILYLLSGGFSEFILIGGAIFLGLPLPVLAAQILWINIVEDTLPAMALSYEKEKKGALEKKNLKKKSKILDKKMKLLITLIALSTDFILLALFIHLYKINWGIEHLRTLFFAALALDGLFFVFSCKDLKKPIWRYKLFDNLLLNLSVVIGILLVLGAIYTPFLQNILSLHPLNFWDWIILIAIVLFNVLVIELGKIILLNKESLQIKKTK